MNFLLFFAVLLRLASAPSANVSYFFIAAYALMGRAQAIQALALSWVFTMVNPMLAPNASMGSIGRYLVIFAAAASILARRKASRASGSFGKLNVLTFLLVALLLVHSILFSSVVDVSILKVISWGMVMLTLLAAWQGLPVGQREITFRQLNNGLILVLLLSVPLLAIPSIGYAVNGTGFQGLLNHPQAFGPVVALVGAIVGGRILGEKQPSWRDIAVLGMCVILVVLSEARTAGIAMVLGLVVSAMASPKFAGVSRRHMLPGLRSRRFQSVWIVLVLCVLVAGPIFVGPLTSYLFKRSDSTSLIAAADASRGELVQKMITNIVEHPLVGIGFGIASTRLDMVIERDPIIGLPLSAQVEKGVMPIAVVEELGVFGAIAVLAWLFTVLRRGGRAGVSKFAVVVTLLLVNLGESMFFSVGGLGMLLAVLLSGAVTGDPQFVKRAHHG